MQRFNVQFTLSAYDDLDRITDYLLERNVDAALKTYDALMGAAKRLGEFPFIGVMMDDPELRTYGHRKLIVEDFAMIYRVFDEAVVIYHVFNHRQDYAKAFSN